MTPDLCILAVTFVKASIDNNTSMDDTILGLSELSTRIFGDRPSPLEDFVNKNLPAIIHYLEDNLTPEEVCTALCCGR